MSEFPLGLMSPKKEWFLVLFFCPSRPQSNRETQGCFSANLTGLFPLRKRPAPFPLLCQTPLTETLTLFGVYYCWSLSLLSAWRSWCPSVLSSVPISHPAHRLTSKSESSGSTAALWNINFEIVWNTTSSQKNCSMWAFFVCFFIVSSADVFPLGIFYLYWKHNHWVLVFLCWSVFPSCAVYGCHS